ncbi:MAG TPA: phosphoglucosamine mutase, partial [bacterium]|nr:phosphoglucosamine mutase [bacterium]
KAAGRLAGNTLVATVMSNLGLENFLTAQGVTVIRTAVGDRYVLEEMRSGGYLLGGEQSGHIIFYGHNRTGDGVITALQVLHSFVRQNRPFSELTDLFAVYPQRLVNIRVTDKVPFEDIHGLVPLQSKYERELRGKGRILLRYSGTEKLARVMVEAEQQADVDRVCDGLAALIRKEIGA